MKKFTYLAVALSLVVSSCSKNSYVADVLVVGGGTSGVAAGIQSARLGASTIIVEETLWLGGMLTSAGVSATDGEYNLPSGMWGEFRDSLVSHYGSLEALMTGWVSLVQFEPSVGNKIFNDICSKEKNLQVFNSCKLESLSMNKKTSGWTAEFSDKTGKCFKVDAKRVIDATELGDLLPLVGASYDVGMESRYETSEDIAPEEANGIIQDLTYCAVLKDYGHNVTIPQPENYNPADFACSALNPLCVQPKSPDRVWEVDKMITYGKLPNGKYMINWPIEGNDYYANLIEKTPSEREALIQEAKNHTMRFVYFIQKELGYNTLGLADDEYDTEDLLPYIPYHRESRRVHGQVRFTCNHVTDPYTQPQPLYRTNIAVGDYPVDHHHNQYKGEEELPNLYFHPVPSFGIPLGALVPEGVEDFIVAEKSISVSNIVNGATRLQPVVLQIGQVAGILAALSVSDGIPVKDVPVRKVQNEMLSCGGYLQPYLDVKKDDPCFASYQRIGSTGILHAEGRNSGWVDETWLRVSDELLCEELLPFFDLYSVADSDIDSPLTMGIITELVSAAAGRDVAEEIAKILPEYGFGPYRPENRVKRGEFAVIVDKILDPFNSFEVDLEGKTLK